MQLQLLTSEKTHTYPSAGTYKIKITGTLQGFRFDNGGDKLKMLDIKKWGIFDINVSKAFSCLLYTSPSPRDGLLSRMPSSA